MTTTANKAPSLVINAREQFTIDDGFQDATFIARHKIDFADVPQDDPIGWLLEHGLVIATSLRYIYLDTYGQWSMDIEGEEGEEYGTAIHSQGS